MSRALSPSMRHMQTISTRSVPKPPPKRKNNKLELDFLNHPCGAVNSTEPVCVCVCLFAEFLQTHLKNVLASHQQQQPEYVTVSGLGGGVVADDGGGGGDGGSTNMNHQPSSLVSSQQQQQQHQQQTVPTYQQSSPFYSSSSGKGSTISSTALGGSTFRSGGCSGGE